MIVDDVVQGRFQQAQAEVAERVESIANAMNVRDADRLFSYHLWGPKYTKFGDGEPSGRRDAETTRRIVRENLARAKAIEFKVSDLKVDVFGPVAVATFTLDFSKTSSDGEHSASRDRSTLVFVKDGAEWMVVHEHFSPFTGGA
jgi:ketosteroid isomerase-like protein